MKFITYLMVTVAITTLSWKVTAETLPIGLSLNLSSSGAQHSLEFKNGVEAYFAATNKTKRFGKYQLELIAMDDKGKKERAASNTKRLITSKHVLALLSTHQRETQQELANIAFKNKTLFLSASASRVEAPNYAKNYVGYLGASNETHLNNASPLLNQAKKIYLIFEDTKEAEAINETISALVDQDTHIDSLTLDHLTHSEIHRDKNTLFILGENFIYSSLVLKQLAHLGFNESKVLIMPDTGASLVSLAASRDIDFPQFKQIYFSNAVPQHMERASIVKRFKQDMDAYNPRSKKSHQALKGYLLAHVIAEGVYAVVKDIKADSLKDLITLPFQVLDKVVGWVTTAGGNINKKMIADALSGNRNFSLGIGQRSNFGKERILIGNTWLTRSNKGSKFTEAPLIER